MATLAKIKTVQSSTRATVQYLHKESRSEASLFTSAINAPAAPRAFTAAMDGLRDFHKVPDSRIEGRTTVVSFSREEVDPDDFEACESAFKIVERAAQKTWGDRGFPVMLAGQRDGESGFFHVHAVMPNVQLDTGKAMRGDDHSWERAAVILDDEMRAAGMEHSHESVRDRVQAIREHRPRRYQRSGLASEDASAAKRGEVPANKQIADALSEIHADPMGPVTFDELNERLDPCGFRLMGRGKKGAVVFVEHEATGGRKTPRRVRADRVAYALQDQPEVPTSLDDMRGMFKRNKPAREKQQRQEQAEQARKEGKTFANLARQQEQERRARERASTQQQQEPKTKPLSDREQAVRAAKARRQREAQQKDQGLGLGD